MQMRRLGWRIFKGFSEGQRQASGLNSKTQLLIDAYLFRRFNRLANVKRFVFGWIGIVVILLIGLLIQNLALGTYYQTLKPIPGGIYNEGVLGNFTNASPLYATNDADTTVSRLIFSGLLKYNSQGQLASDLASNYAVSDHGLIYTIHLKPHLTWQDGKPLTSSDVVFTYKLIQNPDAASPLQSSWQGIKVTAPNAGTVVFTLPGVLAAFPYNLTNGIVPRHLLSKIQPTDLRSANFNTVSPVGSGPFSWRAIQVSGNGNPTTEQEQIELVPFDHYAGGKPKLQQFVVHVFASQPQLISALASGQLKAAEGLNAMPSQLKHKSSIIQYNLIMRAADMVFFKTSSGLFSDKSVRNSLVEGANVPAIINHLSYKTIKVNEPLLSGQLAYNPAYAEAGFNLGAAKAILSSDGWTASKQGFLVKNGQPLAFTLTAADTPEDHVVAGLLQKQWLLLGVNMSVDYLDNLDFQSAINYHTYDAVLDGISIGEDPDVFVYWDSTQADVRSNNLNLSEYSNPAADESLEAGRSRIDPAIRIAKYAPFLQAWQQDSPALALYQPRLLYLTNGPVYGLSKDQINSPTDRFANVQNWEIRQTKVTN
jgi:peptide/nickel transport system substrate-binding protein